MNFAKQNFIWQKYFSSQSSNYTNSYRKLYDSYEKIQLSSTLRKYEYTGHVKKILKNIQNN